MTNDNVIPTERPKERRGISNIRVMNSGYVFNNLEIQRKGDSSLRTCVQNDKHNVIPTKRRMNDEESQSKTKEL